MKKVLKELIVVTSIILGLNTTVMANTNNNSNSNNVGASYTFTSPTFTIPPSNGSNGSSISGNISHMYASDTTMSYVAKDTGYYSILTRGIEDTKLNFSDGEIFIQDDNSGHDYNACLYVFLEEGKEYYINLLTDDLTTLEIHKGMPTSGYEQTNWNIYFNPDYLYTNNCYTYMLGLYCNSLGDGKPFRENGQNPGEMGGYSVHSNWFTSTEFVDYIVIDRINKIDKIPMYPIKEWEMPREGFYKVALVMAKEYDIHWYRQNPDGSWSHKPGVSKVRWTDWSNNEIYNPRLSDRGIYKDFVNYYEVANLNY